MLKHQSVFMIEGQKGSLLSLPASIQSADSGTGTMSTRKYSLEQIRQAIKETPLESSDTEVKFLEQEFLTSSLKLFSSFQSLHSNDPIDLEGLHESVVDSDEDLADSMDVSTIKEKFVKLCLHSSYTF